MEDVDVDVCAEKTADKLARGPRFYRCDILFYGKSRGVVGINFLMVFSFFELTDDLL